LYHIQLKAGTQFSVTTESKTEVAAFLPAQNAILNDTEVPGGLVIPGVVVSGGWVVSGSLRFFLHDVASSTVPATISEGAL